MRTWVFIVLALIACACSGSSGPEDAHSTPTFDACAYGAFCGGPIPDAPTSLPTPMVPCDVDAGPASDPLYPTCLHHTDCVSNWAATYIDGTCVDQQCVFTEPPALTYCFGGCGAGWGPSGQARCLNPGSTAP